MKQNSNQTTERWGIRYTGIVQGGGGGEQHLKITAIHLENLELQHTRLDYHYIQNLLILENVYSILHLICMKVILLCRHPL